MIKRIKNWWHKKFHQEYISGTGFDITGQPLWVRLTCNKCDWEKWKRVRRVPSKYKAFRSEMLNESQLKQIIDRTETEF